MPQIEQEAELAGIASDLAVLQAEHAEEARRVADLEAASLATLQAKNARRAHERARLKREKDVRAKVAAVRMMKQVSAPTSPVT